MMALAEFEREQTSERNREATMARAERGLWNGGQLLGYDLDPGRKGSIRPNEEEKVIVNFAFDTYLQCGSILETAKILNRHGFRTKDYTSRRDKFHPPEEFCYSSVHHILTNYAYIGKKEINKKKKTENQETLPDNGQYRIVDAVWEPIVNEAKFFEVQALIKKNFVSKHNKAKPIKHNYILNSGLLWCEGCGTEMEGRSGTCARGIRYYYYICKNRDCKFKVPADEIEAVIFKRIKELSTGKGIMTDIIQSTNQKLQKELPQLKDQKMLLQKELTEIKNFADAVMNKWASMAGEDSSFFLKDRLDRLAKRRKEVETGIQSLEEMIEEIERESVNQELVMLALNKFTDIFDHIEPYRQKELLSLVLHKALLSPNSIKIALYGRPPEIGLFSLSASEIRSQTLTWLPRPDSNQRPDG